MNSKTHCQSALITGITSLCLSANAQFSFTNLNAKLTNPNFHSGVAVSVADMDNDGLDDIIRMDMGHVVYIEKQKTNGQFQSQFVYDVGSNSAWAMCVADVDHNGQKDILADNDAGIVILKANANGTSYTNTLLPNSGFFLQNANFADINDDGWEDIFGCDDNAASHVWLNDGAGNFAESGIINFNVTATDNSGNYGSVWTDFDNDGDLDLYIAKCRQGVNDPTDGRRINVMFVNDGNENYTSNAAAYGIAIGAQTWTASFGDIDNDADLDLLVTNHDVPSQILENDGTGHYTDITNSTGFSIGVTPIQSVMEDFDNDGFLDILISGSYAQLFRNNGDKTFSLQANPFDNNNMESFAIGDLNHDGKIDVYGSYATIYTNPNILINDVVWMNAAANSNHFISVDLEGTISNKDALGARVSIYGPWGVQIREVRAGESYGTCNSAMLHFGLGSATYVDSIVIGWPSGLQTVVDNPAIDQFVNIIEGDCISLNNVVSTTGAFVICPNQSLTLTAPSASSYLWSTGETTQSISTDVTGEFNVKIQQGDCSSYSQTLMISQSPDQTPTISSMGQTTFCEGSSVTLTTNEAFGYLWSSGEQTQSIEATETGEYFVTIQGNCAEFVSQTFQVDVLPANIPLTNDATISSAQAVTLTAIGDDVHWFDAPSLGTELANSNTFITPTVTSDATYYVENWTSYGGGNFNGGKTYSNGQYSGGNSTNALTFFDVQENCTLHSVKVYTDIAGERLIELRNSLGVVLDSRLVNLPVDSSIVILNFGLVNGVGYTLGTNTDNNIALWGNNSPRLQRNNGGVTYPYDIQNVVSITGSDQGPSLYYYFYDWNITIEPTVCISERIPVNINLVTSANEVIGIQNIFVSPNPANQNISISIPSNEMASTAQIYDINGKLVLQANLKKTDLVHNLNIESLQTGLYSIKLSNSGSVRFVKQ